MLISVETSEGIYHNCVALKAFDLPEYAINSDGIVIYPRTGRIAIGNQGLIDIKYKRYRIGRLVGECFWDKPEEIWKNSPYKEDILLHGEFRLLPINAKKCLNIRHRFGGYYWVTDKGEVWDDYEMKKFKKAVSSSGFEFVHIGTQHNIPIHRLVANYFINIPVELKSIPPNELRVRHKDGNKLNNHVGNLEWCTKDEAHGNVKLSNADLINIDNERAAGTPVNEIAKRYNVAPNTISSIIRRSCARYKEVLGEQRESTEYRGNMVPQDKIDKAVELINRGVGRKLICSIVGISSPKLSEIWKTDKRVTATMKASTNVELSPEKKEEIFSLLEEGKTDWYIRGKVNVGTARIKAIRNRELYAEDSAGRTWPMDPSNIVTENIKDRNTAIESFYRSNPGISINEVCDKFNVSTNTVKRALGLI